MSNIIESFAIILIIGAMVLIYLRAKKKTMALAMLPLVFVPFMHIAAWLVNMCFSNQFIVNSNAYVVFDLIGLAAAAVMSSLCATKFSKKMAVVYLTVVILFSIALTAILIINNLHFCYDTIDR